MTMAPPAAPAAPAAPSPASPASTGAPSARPGGARRRPGEFGGSRKFTPRRKVCQFCVDKVKEVDYKDLVRLRRFLSERGKIEPRRKTGTCAAHQRSLNIALKRARQLALLPFTAEHIRVTGVLVREPGMPPFRGSRPRPQEADGAATEGAAAAAPAEGQPAAENQTAPTDGQAAPAVASAASEAALAESAATEPAPTASEPTASEPTASEPATSEPATPEAAAPEATAPEAAAPEAVAATAEA